MRKNTNNQIVLEEFKSVLKKSKKQKILVIGEIIYDEYLYSSPQGQPSKENILAVNFEKKETFLGGVLPVIKNISQFCNDVTFATIYQEKSIKNKLNNYFQNRVKLKLFRNKEFVDIRKKRYVNINTFSKIFETYHYVNKDFDDQNFKKIFN